MAQVSGGGVERWGRKPSGHRAPFQETRELARFCRIAFDALEARQTTLAEVSQMAAHLRLGNRRFELSLKERVEHAESLQQFCHGARVRLDRARSVRILCGVTM